MLQFWLDPDWAIKYVAIFVCHVGSFPSTCPGFPWCIGQPRKAIWEPNITFQEEALYMRELSHEGCVLICTL